MNDWARVLQHTRRRINPYDFATWFRPTRLERTETMRFLVRVPTRLCKKRLTETYSLLLQAVLQELGMADTQLEFHCLEREPPAPSSTPRLAGARDSQKVVVQLQVDRVTIKMIQERVGEHFGVFPPDLKLRSGSQAAVLPRQVAMYLVKQLTSASFAKIGREFGGRHPSSVLMSIQKIEGRRRIDIDLNLTISKLSDSLRWHDPKEALIDRRIDL
jgi:chromosomal replication initiation ATPase DnaA